MGKGIARDTLRRFRDNYSEYSATLEIATATYSTEKSVEYVPDSSATEREVQGNRCQYFDGLSIQQRWAIRPILNRIEHRGL